MRVKAKQAAASNFAMFGKVVMLPAGTPTSQARDYKFWSDIADYTIEGDTEIGICTVYKQRVQRISGVERHLSTPEILIPIDAPFVLPLMENGTRRIEAFRCAIGQAVVIGSGVWHGAALPVGKKEASYFVIFRKGTPHEDVEKMTIDPPVSIVC